MDKKFFLIKIGVKHFKKKIFSFEELWKYYHKCNVPVNDCVDITDSLIDDEYIIKLIDDNYHQLKFSYKAFELEKSYRFFNPTYIKDIIKIAIGSGSAMMIVEFIYNIIKLKFN